MLSTSSLWGSLPTELGLLTGLQELSLDNNSLEGPIPPELGLLSGLQLLWLSSNSLDGSLPSELGLTTGLSYLDLNSNSLEGPIPPELWLLIGLEYLDLSSNLLDGSLPSELGLMTGLSYLYLNSNSLEGPIPPELWLLIGLGYLDLSSNSLVGSTPAVMEQMTGLQKLRLNGNRLTGLLPTQLGLLTGLQHLDLSSNSLDGSLPSELGLLTGLTSLNLYTNSLDGSIPSELWLLTEMQHLWLYNNSFTGTVPTELGLLIALFELNLDMNSLTSTLPTELGCLTGLEQLSIHRNSLVGEVPSELGLLRELIYLRLDSNRLVGLIPSEIGLLTGLQGLYLHSNRFEGSLPSEFWLLTNLQYLSLGDNSLNGSLSPQLSLMSGLTYLDLSSNSFEGSLPSELGLLTGLLNIYLYSNSFEGSLPTQLGLLTGLQQLFIYVNSFEGSLPTQLGLLTGLECLNLQHNRFEGTLPTEMGLMTGLQYLNLYENFFVGQIPSELGLLTRMKNLLLYNNRLEGSLPGHFSALVNLRYLDVHGNSLSGQLPLKFPPSLEILSLGQNCFTSTLAHSICDATKLVYLMLDGLSAGSACRVPIWPDNPFGFNARRSTSRVSGSIPACIYSLPNLKTLHISGNGLRGSLHAGPAGWSANLTDLSLSHNALTGEVPLSLKLRLGQLARLDLSYNRLKGTLDGFRTDPASNQSNLLLYVNRLSGRIPSAVTRIKGVVSVLQGNLFDCSWHDHDASLPPADPAYSEYSCGSHAIDVYLFVLASLLALSAASYCFFPFKWRPMLHWLAWKKMAALEALQKRPVSIQAVLYRVRSLALLAGSVLLLQLMPLYGALKPFFGTYTFQYSWTVAAIMLSGTAPAAVLLAFWTLALGFASASILVWFRDLKGSTDASVCQAVGNVPTWNERCRLALRLVIIATLNLAVAGAANIAFVAVAVGRYSSTDKSLATVALGLYKTTWSYLLPHVIESEFLLFGVDRAAEEQSKFLKAGDLFRTLLLIVNNVAMPAVAVAVTDPSCFKHLLYTAPSTQSSYEALVFVPATANYSSYVIPAMGTVILTPAFSYDYECTSTLVEKFSPVFAQVALTSAFVVPLLAAGARSALDSSIMRRHDFRGRLRGVYLAMLPSLLLYRKSERDEPGCLRFLRSKMFIKADEVLRQSVTDGALMLSIGLVAPLLGLMFAASIVSRCLMWEFLVDRFLSLPDEQLEGDLQALEKQCLQLGSLGNTALYNARWLLAIFPSLFLALFVADIAGDAAGIESVLWAPILMALLPPAVLVALTRLLPVGNELLVEAANAKFSFALSEITSVPVAGNPLHAAPKLTGDDMVEMMCPPSKYARGGDDAIKEHMSCMECDSDDLIELAVLRDPIPEPTFGSEVGGRKAL